MKTIGPLRSLSYVPSAVEPKLNTAPVFLNMEVISIPSSSRRERKKEATRRGRRGDQEVSRRVLPALRLIAPRIRKRRCEEKPRAHLPRAGARRRKRSSPCCCCSSCCTRAAPGPSPGQKTWKQSSGSPAPPRLAVAADHSHSSSAARSSWLPRSLFDLPRSVHSLAVA